MFAGAGRYNEGYSESYLNTFENSPFQTVPGGATNGPEWGHHDMGSGHIGHGHPHSHPAFISGMTGRDSLVQLGPDTKPMIQNGMLTGYPSSGNTGGACFTGMF